MELVFAEKDVGLGTAYERVAIYRLLDRWTLGRGVRTAFEGPIDGMAGIPGLHLLGLARAGVHVTVALTRADAIDRVVRTYRGLGLEDRLTAMVVENEWAAIPGTYDLALTYNALPMVGDEWRRLLDSVARLATRWLVVSVTNPWSYGVWLRRALRVAEGPAAPHDELFDHESTRPGVLEPALERVGRCVKREHLDCPWWPDLFVPIGETLASGTLGRLPVVGPRWTKRDAAAAPAPGHVYPPEDFPLLDPAGPVDAAMRRHPAFDERGELLGRLFGHHRAYLIDRSNTSNATV